MEWRSSRMGGLGSGPSCGIGTLGQFKTPDMLESARSADAGEARCFASCFDRYVMKKYLRVSTFDIFSL